jgi:hypothetical protein
LVARGNQFSLLQNGYVQAVRLNLVGATTAGLLHRLIVEIIID